jgi:hypothetical protein
MKKRIDRALRSLRLHSKPPLHCVEMSRVCVLTVVQAKGEVHRRTSLIMIMTFLAGSLLIGGTAMAQIAGSGVVQGTITDPSGAVVPGATVVGTNEATQVKITVHTTSAGFYVLSPLPPGDYTVTVTARGFQTLVQEHVVVNALTVVGLNPVLKVGATTQQVTVTASPPALNTSNGTLGVTVPRKTYLDLPLSMSNSQRSPEGFIYLLPGVAHGAGFVGNINGGIAFSKEIYTNGLPIVLEGLQADPRNVDSGIPVDAIDQFQIDTNGTPPHVPGARQ